MRREGYHRIVLTSGEVIEGPLVVELDVWVFVEWLR